MNKEGECVFLGTGGSMGIPVIGCACAVCVSKLSYNKRFRPSILLKIEKKNFLIDCGPDFRMQALTHHLDEISGLFLTHAHYDHIAGIDELRIFNIRTKSSIPCLLSKETTDELKIRYKYLFELESQGITTQLDLHLLKEDQGEVLFEGIPVQYMTYQQAGMCVNGYRFGNLAYISDIKEYSDSIFSILEGVDTLILSALRFARSPFHLNIDDAIKFSERVKAKNTWLTHISHELDHEQANSYLPSNIRMAYDGLKLKLTL